MNVFTRTVSRVSETRSFRKRYLWTSLKKSLQTHDVTAKTHTGQQKVNKRRRTFKDTGLKVTWASRSVFGCSSAVIGQDWGGAAEKQGQELELLLVLTLLLLLLKLVPTKEHKYLRCWLLQEKEVKEETGLSRHLHCSGTHFCSIHYSDSSLHGHSVCVCVCV